MASWRKAYLILCKFFTPQIKIKTRTSTKAPRRSSRARMRNSYQVMSPVLTAPSRSPPFFAARFFSHLSLMAEKKAEPPPPPTKIHNPTSLRTDNYAIWHTGAQTYLGRADFGNRFLVPKVSILLRTPLETGKGGYTPITSMAFPAQTQDVRKFDTAVRHYITADYACPQDPTIDSPDINDSSDKGMEIRCPYNWQHISCNSKYHHHFNRLGLPFPFSRDDPRHWLQRAWTLQEIATETTTSAGVCGKSSTRVITFSQ